MKPAQSRPLPAAALLLLISLASAVLLTACGTSDPLAKLESETGVDAVEPPSLPDGWERISVTTETTGNAQSIVQNFSNPDVPGEWFQVTHYSNIRMGGGGSITINGEPATRDFLASGPDFEYGRLTLFWEGTERDTLIWATIGENLTEEMVMDVAEKLRAAE